MIVTCFEFAVLVCWLYGWIPVAFVIGWLIYHAARYVRDVYLVMRYFSWQ